MAQAHMTNSHSLLRRLGPKFTHEKCSSSHLATTTDGWLVAGDWWLVAGARRLAESGKRKEAKGRRQEGPARTDNRLYEVSFICP